MLCKTNQHTKKLKQHEKLTNVLDTDFKKIIIEITETNDSLIYAPVLVSGCSKKVNASDLSTKNRT